jgi:hypothetical protein
MIGPSVFCGSQNFQSTAVVAQYHVSKLSSSPSSGKTTLLAKAAGILSRKVQRSNESDGSLVFPLNMRLHHLYLDDPQQFSITTTNILFDAFR